METLTVAAARRPESVGKQAAVQGWVRFGHLRRLRWLAHTYLNTSQSWI